MTFNAKKVKDELVNWIRKTFEENGKNCTAVIGISGGKDSTVAAALCAEALRTYAKRRAERYCRFLCRSKTFGDKKH